MNRRGFLRGALGAAAASLVPVSLLASGYKEPAVKMALKGNNFDSHYTKALMKSFLDKFERDRVLSKALDCKAFSATSNNTVIIKRPAECKPNE